MTTVVEAPLRAFSTTQNSQPHQSRSHPIEIIDVDAFEETPSDSQRRRSRPRPRTETILLLDSDDEEVEFVASRLRQGHEVDRNRSHRRFISPAPRDPSAPPPVPSIPRQHAGHTSYPMRQRQQQVLPPVIPISQPLAFERTSMPPVAGPSNPIRRSPERGVPPSHHVPSMGLGGALISSNRAQAIQRQRDVDTATTNARRARRMLNSSYRARIPGREYAVNPFTVTDRDDDVYIHMLLNPFMDADAELMHPRWRSSFHFRRRSEPKDEQYRQSYTHPTPPDPGFTFDFAPPPPDETSSGSGRFFPATSRDEPIILDDDDDEDKPIAGPSTNKSEPSQLNQLLVCANCNDPLILNATMDPEEAQYKRIWALRCGHLIDERCLNALGQPPAEEVIPDKKGKAKAKAPASIGVLSEPQAPADAAGPTNIRSRLRSRRSAAGVGDTPASSASSLPALGDTSRTQPTTPPSAKKRKVTQKKPKIQAEFEWACPVASCGRVHVSVKVEGIWGPEKETPSRGAGKAGDVWTGSRGAIPVFA